MKSKIRLKAKVSFSNLDIIFLKEAIRNALKHEHSIADDNTFNKLLAHLTPKDDIEEEVPSK